MSKTRKTVPWKGWKQLEPSTKQRTQMLKKCGNKCFLGPNKTFPVCAKGTCKVNQKGLWAAYVRAKEYVTIKGTKKYKNIAKKAASKLKRKPKS